MFEIIVIGSGYASKGNNSVCVNIYLRSILGLLLKERIANSFL